MKLKDDFKAQAGISRAIAWEMTSHQQYFDLLEARLPEMADKGQAESLRIKLRILLEMLGETQASPPRSAEDFLESEIIVNHKIAGEDIPLIQLSGAKRAMHAYASQFRREVTDEEIEDVMTTTINAYPFDVMKRIQPKMIEPTKRLCITSAVEGAKWMRSKMTGE